MRLDIYYRKFFLRKEKVMGSSVAYWIPWILGAIILFCILGLVHNTILLKRIGTVATYRRNLLKKMYEAALQDIQRGKPHDWRFEEYERVSFREMVNKFWKPLDSFYKNMSFAENSPKETEATPQEEESEQDGGEASLELIN